MQLIILGLLVDEYKDAYPNGISSHVIEWDSQKFSLPKSFFHHI